MEPQGENGNTPTIEYGGVAQLGERLLCKQEAIGSIPFISTMGSVVKPPLKPRNGLIAQPVRAHA